MSLFAIGDLHLSLGVPSKPMDIFGGWKNYQQLIEENWLANISADDTVVLAGDLSWGMSLEQSDADFAFVHRMPGRKIILKGNHDYWWNSLRKMQNFFDEKGYDSLNILHNNHIAYGEYGICGTRGWVSMSGEPADAKVLAREVQRLEVSIKSALDESLCPLVFLHYPPIYGNSCNYDLLEILHKYKIQNCYYGHVHGKGHNHAFQGMYEETKMEMISSDYLHFIPQKIM